MGAGVGEGYTMWDLYQDYWKPFGELLTDMEKEGMMVDRCVHLGCLLKSRTSLRRMHCVPIFPHQHEIAAVSDGPRLSRWRCGCLFVL